LTLNKDAAMSCYQIAGLPGDGIGPECLAAAVHVLQAVESVETALQLDITSHSAGAEHYRQHGVALPDAVLKACLDADAVLLAAVGLPDVRKPDGTEIQPDIMMVLRRALGLYAAVRPIKLWPGVPPVVTTAPQGIDCVILRENLEGLFASYGGGCQLNNQVATDTIIITRDGTERIVEYAFRLAARRKGRPSDGLKKVTCVDKANIFRSFAFFRRVFFEVAARHPEIIADAMYVDAMSLHLVTTPSEWDVLVMENQFGDILSDLGAGVVGGLGMAPSAEVGEQHGLFQPSHGTAPQLAGKNLCNPIAMILSAAMMLDWLGERTGDAVAIRAARRMEMATSAVLASRSVLTRDLGGTSSTSDVAEAIAARVIADGDREPR
jgi:3-isopropylmalate dehydrogenase